MMLGVEVSGAPYGGDIFEPGAAASVAIVAGLAMWALARWRGPGRAAALAVLLAMWAIDSGDSTLDQLYASTPAAEAAVLIPDDEPIGEVFVDTAAVSPNLTNAVVWEVGFDQAVTETTSATSHLLIAVDAVPPPDSVIIAEFRGGTLWRLP